MSKFNQFFRLGLNLLLTFNGFTENFKLSYAPFNVSNTTTKQIKGETLEGKYFLCTNIHSHLYLWFDLQKQGLLYILYEGD